MTSPFFLSVTVFTLTGFTSSDLPQNVEVTFVLAAYVKCGPSAKPALIGGLLRTQRIAALAAARGVGVIVTTLLDGAVGRAAAPPLSHVRPRQVTCAQCD